MSYVLENISKYYRGESFINDVTLEIKDGDFVTLLGRTGSGKTTLLRILAGIERPDKGRVLQDGVDITNVPVQKRNVAMVYQQFINYPSFTVYENIASPLRVSGKKYSEQEIDKRVRETAELLNISHILNHLPEEVSGGQQQRTAIARALVKDVSLIILDEPLANLDYKLREELRGELKRIFKGRKGCIVYATPEPIDALSMSSHVAYMQEGDMVQYGPVNDVYTKPLTVDVGKYFSHPTMNIFETSLIVEGGKKILKGEGDISIDLKSAGIDLDPGDYLVGTYAYHIGLQKLSDKSFLLKSKIGLSEVVGSDTELHLEHSGIKMVVLVQDIVKYKIGDSIDAYVDPEKLFIFNKMNKKLVAKTF